MGTRLRYEKMIREALPRIRYLRVYSPGEFKVFIYACDEMLYLDEELKELLSSFLRDNGLAHLNHEVKHYFCIKEDNVPQIDEPPQEIKRLALTGGLNQAGILLSINKAFPFLRAKSLIINNDSVSITLPQDVCLTDIERYILKLYLYDILPLGLRVELLT